MTIKYTIVIDNVCGWPNLTKMEDGSIITTVFNKPSHLCMEGELDCYISYDDGYSWNFLSRPVEHDKGTARGNCSCGLTSNNYISSSTL